MSALRILEIPTGYARAIRFGANWTMIISPYLVLYMILVIFVGLQDDSGDMGVVLKFAGSHSPSFIATVFLDGLFHVLFFVTVIALFTGLRESFPVQANLILICSAWQMLMGFTKGMISSFVFPKLGSAYLAADPTLQMSIIPTADAFNALRNALQWMDSLGVMFVWILVSLLPEATRLPRLVRWLGRIMAFGILAPESIFPGFLLVILFSGPWLFMLGRWMKRLTLGLSPTP